MVRIVGLAVVASQAMGSTMSDAVPGRAAGLPLALAALAILVVVVVLVLRARRARPPTPPGDDDRQLEDGSGGQ
jgi:hypothetical protein